MGRYLINRELWGLGLTGDAALFIGEDGARRASPADDRTSLHTHSR